MTEFYPQTLVDYAQIVGALATSAAVIVSLYLSNKKPKPNLDISCDINVVILLDQDASEQPTKYLSISAINIGNIDATITSIGWKLNSLFSKSKWAMQMVSSTSGNLRNPSLPHKMAHGETAKFNIALQGQDNWAKAIEEHGLFIESITTRRALDNLRAVVSTSVGPPILCKPSKGALDMMWEHQQVCLQSKKHSTSTL